MTTKHQFKLNFQSSTVVTNFFDDLITVSPYSFVSFLEIVGKIDMDYLIDVVVILSAVGRERVYERNGVTTKFNVIELQSDGMKLDYTLFGPYVDELDAYLKSGNTDPVVVLAQYLKVKLYNGKIQMQNAMNCTKLLFNPKTPEADSLKLNDNIGSPTQSFSYMKDASEMSLEEDFLNLSQRKTIEELKDCQDNMVCVVLGTIKHVSGGNDWWYAACVCNKGVVVDSRRLFCPKCDKHIWTIIPRFRVKLRVIDETDSATFVLFDRNCYFLTEMTCSDLIAEMDREEEPTIVAKVIGGFVDQTFLFKIDVKNDVSSGYEQSFRVKKVCAGKDIISKFKSAAKVDNTLFHVSSYFLCNMSLSCLFIYLINVTIINCFKNRLTMRMI
ncbi:uncharacterized protein LOC131647495 [Vicia villosa]|uniref:uncharacterized protein LOC131647495 n=1 Tax=Vicia villosa TaxID=3911 RepID=UPI00273C4D60|nr:uncharacterized protein LOC131647495 [Vicia villosa]